jgi:hypothetical protein
MPYTWTPPVTWVATDVPDYTDMNDISENLRFLHTKDRVHVYDSVDQSIGNAGWELMTWDSEEYDNNDMHSTSSTTARLSCKSDGLYLVEFKIAFASNTTGVRRVMLRKNSAGSDSGGSTLGTWNEDALTGQQTTVSGGRGVVLNTGGSPNDYIECFVWQDSGAALNVVAGASTSFVQMMQITG